MMYAYRMRSGSTSIWCAAHRPTRKSRRTITAIIWRRKQQLKKNKLTKLNIHHDHKLKSCINFGNSGQRIMLAHVCELRCIWNKVKPIECDAHTMASHSFRSKEKYWRIWPNRKSLISTEQIEKSAPISIRKIRHRVFGTLLQQKKMFESTGFNHLSSANLNSQQNTAQRMGIMYAAYTKLLTFDWSIYMWRQPPLGCGVWHDVGNVERAMLLLSVQIYFPMA